MLVRQNLKNLPALKLDDLEIFWSVGAQIIKAQGLPTGRSHVRDLGNQKSITKAQIYGMRLQLELIKRGRKRQTPVCDSLLYLIFYEYGHFYKTIFKPFIASPGT